ncbi:MAG: hypothetical protein RL255_92, partial [Actinomycetota bacterium]
MHRLARSFAAALRKSGFNLFSENFFDTVSFKADNAEALVESARRAGFNVRRISNGVSLAFDETTTEQDLIGLSKIWALNYDPAELVGTINLLRKTNYLQHPIFNSYQSETAMLRYLRTLSDRDLALDRTMIPLGSCTMKLNATTEMEAITWPEFSNLHPFAPSNQSSGTRRIIKELSDWLVSITG